MSSFKAFEKRNKTLLVEYKNQFKSNSFVDKRIGENDQNLTLEDKMFKRFVAERKKSKDKKGSKFNLNDDDDNNNDDDQPNGVHTELTHFGQSLASIEKFEKVQSSDDDDDKNPDPNDKDRGKISAKIVSENFFGGFKKDDEESKRLNRKQWIDELILKSKQLKYERQKERDKTLDLTEELDKEWRNIQPLINVMVNKNKEKYEELEKVELTKTKKSDDYDVLVRSLQFDSKAKPQDKLKTEEELEKERLENLEQKEKELLERMNNETVVNDDDDDENNKNKKSKNIKKNKTSNHRSVDDMDFDDPEYLQYNNMEDIKRKRKNELIKEREQTEEKKLDQQDQNENESDGGDDEEEEEEEVASSDLSSKSEEAGSEENDYKNDHWVSQFEQICLRFRKNAIDVKQFEKLIRSLIDRLDPSKEDDNKKRLCLLTQHMVGFYQSLFVFKSLNCAINVNLAKICTNIIYELTAKYGGKSTKQEPSMYIVMFRKILTDLNNEYLSLKFIEKTFPQLNIMFTFKLISVLFPTSDFRHHITTPCLLIMTRYFSESSIQTLGQCFRGSFLCNLCYEFISRSKRFIPECIQFLNGVVYLTIDWKKNKNLADFEQSTLFESFKRTKLNLVLTGKVEKLNEISLSQMSQLEMDQVNDLTKASLVAYNIDLLSVFSKAYEENNCFREIFKLTNSLLSMLPKQNYPVALQDKIDKLQSFIENISSEPREHLKCLHKKPVPSKQFEPKIIAKTKFDPRHHNTIISEKQLMSRKIKKEHKSAVKEIRQDAQFLARVQLKDQLEKDAKRSAKVKEIMGSLSMQEGEYQKIKRMKN